MKRFPVFYKEDLEEHSVLSPLKFKEKLFDKTSSVNNPWVIVDAEDKRVSGLNAIRYVLQSIPYEGKDEKVLDKDYPEALAILKP